MVDHIIDIGPEGGKKGGNIIFEGKPEEIVKNKKSYTGPVSYTHLTLPTNREV